MTRLRQILNRSLSPNSFAGACCSPASRRFVNLDQCHAAIPVHRGDVDRVDAWIQGLEHRGVVAVLRQREGTRCGRGGAKFDEISRLIPVVVVVNLMPAGIEGRELRSGVRGSGAQAGQRLKRSLSGKVSGSLAKNHWTVWCARQPMALPPCQRSSRDQRRATSARQRSTGITGQSGVLNDQRRAAVGSTG